MFDVKNWVLSTPDFSLHFDKGDLGWKGNAYTQQLTAHTSLPYFFEALLATKVENVPISMNFYVIQSQQTEQIFQIFHQNSILHTSPSGAMSPRLAHRETLLRSSSSNPTLPQQDRRTTLS